MSTIIEEARRRQEAIGNRLVNTTRKERATLCDALVALRETLPQGATGYDPRDAKRRREIANLLTKYSELEKESQ